VGLAACNQSSETSFSTLLSCDIIRAAGANHLSDQAARENPRKNLGDSVPEPLGAIYATEPGPQSPAFSRDGDFQRSFANYRDFLMCMVMRRVRAPPGGVRFHAAKS